MNRERWLRLLATTGGAILLVVLTCSVVRCVPAEEPVPCGAGAPKVPYQTCIEFDDLAESAVFLLVKLTDTVNYPHVATSQIILKSLLASGDLSGNNDWDIHISVITGTNATEGGTVRAYVLHRNRAANFISQVTWPEHGLNLLVVDNSAKYVQCIGTVSSIFSNTNPITSPVGTSYINVGDLVMYVEERTDGSDLDLDLCIAYDTE